MAKFSKPKNPIMMFAFNNYSFWQTVLLDEKNFNSDFQFWEKLTVYGVNSALLTLK